MRRGALLEYQKSISGVKTISGKAAISGSSSSLKMAAALACIGAWLLGALASPQVGVVPLAGPSIATPHALFAEVALDSLGVVVQVANSLLPSAGRGLFLRLDEGVEDAIIPSGTPLCGYCDGVLVEQAIGDKVKPAPTGHPQEQAPARHVAQPLPASPPRAGGPVCVWRRAAAGSARRRAQTPAARRLRFRR
jgi:hypothetical protein